MGGFGAGAQRERADLGEEDGVFGARGGCCCEGGEEEEDEGCEGGREVHCVSLFFFFFFYFSSPWVLEWIGLFWLLVLELVSVGSAAVCGLIWMAS